MPDKANEFSDAISTGERDLRQANSMLQRVLDTIPVRVFWKDRSSVYMGCNRLFAQDAGLSEPTEIVGKTDYELCWPEQAELYRADDARVMETGEAKIGYEEPQDRPEHDKNWIRTSKVPLTDGEGQIIGVLGTYEDITAQRRMQSDLARSEAEFVAIINAMSDAVIFTDTQRRISMVNPAFIRMFGYSFEEVKGETTKRLYAESNNFSEQGQARFGAEARSDATLYEMPYRRKSGGVFDSETMGVKVEDGAGKLLGFLGVIRDISERRQAAREKEKLQRQMQHVQKLESLGVLAGGIAHDFNNLLMAILGNADLAANELPAGQAVQGNLEEIVEASRQAADLCRQLLAYSGKGRFVVEPLAINDVIEGMAHMLEISVSKKAVLKFNLASNLPAVEADASQMRQILMNLVINASEAIAERSGIISVSSGAMNCDAAYFKDTYLDVDVSEGTYVYMEVADTGCGMDEDTRAKLFDPFFTTKFTGRGLGMAAALGIVRGHRGTIKVYSEPGMGTTIKVLLPASAQSVARHEGEPGDASAWQGQGLVLLVDDEETVRTVGKRMLERLGFSVLTASDGREALRLFESRRREIRLVLLDLTMPHVDGEEAFRELRRLKHNVCVVMASGYNEQEVTQRFVGKGLAAFIQKPYQLKQLRAVLRRALDE